MCRMELRELKVWFSMSLYQFEAIVWEDSTHRFKYLNLLRYTLIPPILTTIAILVFMDRGGKNVSSPLSPLPLAIAFTRGVWNIYQRHRLSKIFPLQICFHSSNLNDLGLVFFFPITYSWHLKMIFVKISELHNGRWEKGRKSESESVREEGNRESVSFCPLFTPQMPA